MKTELASWLKDAEKYPLKFVLCYYANTIQLQLFCAQLVEAACVLYDHFQAAVECGARILPTGNTAAAEQARQLAKMLEHLINH